MIVNFPGGKTRKAPVCRAGKLKTVRAPKERMSCEMSALELSRVAMSRLAEMSAKQREELGARLMAHLCLEVEAIAETLDAHLEFSELPRYKFIDLPHGRFLALKPDDEEESGARQGSLRVFDGSLGQDDDRTLPQPDFPWQGATLDDYLGLAGEIVSAVKPLVCVLDALDACVEYKRGLEGDRSL
jgi:hypothetical protein